ncbi:MAG: hypothetical protein ACKV2Q_16885 [Planctomycetaceae bacterium]
MEQIVSPSDEDRQGVRGSATKLDRLLSELATAETPADLRRLNAELIEMELDQILAADAEKLAALLAEIQAADHCAG